MRTRIVGPTPLPWAILLCRFQDDINDPGQTLMSSLYDQWLKKYGQLWMSQNLTGDASSDDRTILELYFDFFTKAGSGTFNATRYWADMSHGSVDITGSQVFPCVLDIDTATGAALAQNPGGAAYQNLMFQKAKAALLNQHGVNWQDYYAVAVSFQTPDYGAQGGWYDGGPGVYMDMRWIRNNGIQAWGQEMGHAFGLDHSRQDGSDTDYQDSWDVMSTRNAFSGSDEDFGARGPGLDAWNMRGRKWLDESRIWKGPKPVKGFDELVELRPLHRRDLTGFLGAELPGILSSSAYLVEFRVPTDWDKAIPNPGVLVHRFEGPIGQFLGTHSYLMRGTMGQLSLSTGDAFSAVNVGLNFFQSVSATVVSIDTANEKAEVQLSYSMATRAPPPPIPTPWWEWNPRQLESFVAQNSRKQIESIIRRAEQSLQTIRRFNDERKEDEPAAS